MSSIEAHGLCHHVRDLEPINAWNDHCTVPRHKNSRTVVNVKYTGWTKMFWEGWNIYLTRTKVYDELSFKRLPSWNFGCSRVYIRFTLPNKGHIYWRLDVCQSITYEHVCILYFPVKWVSILTLCSFTFQFWLPEPCQLTWTPYDHTWLNHIPLWLKKCLKKNRKIWKF